MPPQTHTTIRHLRYLDRGVAACSSLVTAADRHAHELLGITAPSALRAAGLEAVLLGIRVSHRGAEGWPDGGGVTTLGTRDATGVIVAADAGIDLPAAASDLRELVAAFAAAVAGSARHDSNYLVLLTVHGSHYEPWDNPDGDSPEEMLAPTRPVWLWLAAAVDGALPQQLVDVGDSPYWGVNTSGGTTRIIWGGYCPPDTHAAATAAFKAAAAATAAAHGVTLGEVTQGLAGTVDIAGALTAAAEAVEAAAAAFVSDAAAAAPDEAGDATPTPAAVDHAVRAEHLRAFAADIALLNTDCFAHASVDLHAPRVPQRYACAQFDGREAYLVFADTLRGACDAQRDAPCDQYPWGPGDVVDLDTGARYATRVDVTLTRHSHEVAGSILTNGRWVKYTTTLADVAAAVATAERWRGRGYVDVTVAALPSRGETERITTAGRSPDSGEPQRTAKRPPA